MEPNFATAVTQDVFILLLGMYGEYNMKEATTYDAHFFPSAECAYLCTQGRSWGAVLCMMSIFTLLLVQHASQYGLTSIGCIFIRAASFFSHLGIAVFLIISVTCESVTLYALFHDSMDTDYGIVLYVLTTALFVILNIAVACISKPATFAPALSNVPRPDVVSVI